jgi:purine-nucleoside phosphorylase
MAGLMGADAVGMSVAPEVILARRLGLKVSAVSLITNYGAGYQGGAPTHDQTKLIAATGAQKLAMLLGSFIEGLDTP